MSNGGKEAETPTLMGNATVLEDAIMRLETDFTNALGPLSDIEATKAVGSATNTIDQTIVAMATFTSRLNVLRAALIDNVYSKFGGKKG